MPLTAVFVLGGTADITIHEKVEDGKLRELHHATGGACGGTAVDAVFESLLTNILGENVMKTLREQEPQMYLDIFRGFESIKRKLYPDSTDTYGILFAIGELDEICKRVEKKTLEEMLKDKDGMYLKSGRLYIDIKTLHQCFEPSIEELLSHIKSVMDKPKTNDISMVFLVGGSADSKMIQFKVAYALKEHAVKVVIPPDAQLVVLKGAVLFGHTPTIIMSRILRFSYGTKVCMEFDPEVHKKEKKFTIDGKDMCRDCFSVILKAGTEVKLGHVEAGVYSTSSPFQLIAAVEVFCSPLEEVQYIDDEQCFKLGEINVCLLEGLIKNEENEPRNHTIFVMYIFGNTELQLTAIDDASRKRISCYLDMDTDNTRENES